MQPRSHRSLASHANRSLVVCALATFARGSWLALALQVLAVLLAALEWALFPSYTSEVTFVVPPGDEYGGVSRWAREIEQNERFLATQISILNSPQFRRSVAETLEVSSSPFWPELATSRVPFDNTVTMKATGPEESAPADWLEAAVETYEEWLADGGARTIAGMRAHFEGERAHHQASLAKAKASVADWLESPEGAADPQATLQWQALVEARDRLESAERELRRIDAVERDARPMVDLLGPPTAPGRVNGFASTWGRRALAGILIALAIAYVRVLRTSSPLGHSGRGDPGAASES